MTNQDEHHLDRSTQTNQTRTAYPLGLAPVQLKRRHRLVLDLYRNICADTPGRDAALSVSDMSALLGLSRAAASFARHDLVAWGFLVRVGSRGRFDLYQVAADPEVVDGAEFSRMMSRMAGARA